MARRCRSLAAPRYGPWGEYRPMCVPSCRLLAPRPAPENIRGLLLIELDDLLEALERRMLHLAGQILDQVRLVSVDFALPLPGGLRIRDRRELRLLGFGGALRRARLEDKIDRRPQAEPDQQHRHQQDGSRVDHVAELPRQDLRETHRRNRLDVAP